MAMVKLLFPILVAFRANAAQKRAWRAQARRSHKSFSSWVRETLDRAVR